MFKVLVIGAGKRVTGDIIPSLFASGYGIDDIVVWRIQNQKLATFPNIKVIRGFDSIKETRFHKDLIIISCAPPEDQFHTLNNICKIISPKTILIDTPVTFFNEANKLNNYSLEKIYVLEDSMLIPYISKKSSTNYPFFTFVRKALFEYHGSALLERYFDDELEPLVIMNKINLKILRTKNKKNFVIWIGKRNYAKGRASFIHKLASEFQLSKFSNDLGQIYLENLDKYVMNGISLSELCENPIKYMNVWKRIGLFQGFKLLSQQKVIFPSLDAMVRIEEYSKKRLFIKHIVQI